MLDKPLITLIRNALIAGEAVANIAGLPIKQAFQPTQQGVNSEPTAYIFKISDKRYGFPYKADVWDANNQIMVHTELQQYETTFQISALSTQDPSDLTSYTASDILNSIAYILQSDTTIKTLQASEVGILRIMDVRNPHFQDDRQRNEASPSLDFTVTHKQIISTSSPTITKTEFQILTV